MKAITPLMDEVKPNKVLFDFYKISRHYEMREDCLVEGIKRFPAGCYAWIVGDEIQITKWWNTLDHLVEVPNAYEEQVEQFRSCFWFLASCA